MKNHNVGNRMVEIGKIPPNKPCRISGYSALRYCLIYQEPDEDTGQYKENYVALKEPALEAIQEWARPVVFREVVTECGKSIGCPQQMDKANITTSMWQENGLEAVKESVGFPEGTAPADYPDFERRLDAALSDNAIDSLDHPLVQKLLAISKHLVEANNSPLGTVGQVPEANP